MLKRQIAKTPFRLGDAIFDRLVKGSGILVLLLLGGIIISLIIAAWPSINQFGFGFLWHKEWDAPAEQFGALVPIYGTLVTSVIALLIAVPVSFGIAIFLTEIAPNWLKRPLGIAIELLAAIPSIVYGMWGLFVFVPLFADYFQMPVNDVMANIPILNLFFTGPAFGIGILAAGFILSIMIIPYIASVMRDVFEQTPVLMKEAAYGVGSTKWECIRNIVLPYTKNGVIGGIMLGLGRALGETMAVTFIIGNTFQLDSLSLFMPGSTITSVLANEFAEAESGLHTAALMELGLILFFITFIVLGYSKYLILKLNKTSAKSPKSTFKKTIRWVLLVLVCLELIRIQFYENDTPDLQYSALVILAFIVIACVFKLIMSKLLATRSVTKTTHWRQIKNKIALNLASLAVIFGLFWLMWILFSIIEKGFGGLSWDIFTEMTPSPNTAGGGLANAIMGSSLLVVFATLIGTPLGMLAGIYLAEYGKKNLLASVIRFINDILLSAPSIIIGLFVYMLVVVKMGHFSGLAGIIALALIQLPIIVRTTENMLLLIPNTLREAAYALGTPRWKVILNITLKASLSGIVTGVLLAIARIAGETAPLLFTALSNQFWSTDLLHPMANLPVTIFKFAMSPFIEWQQLAWVGVLIITIFVLLLNILARVLFRNKNKIKS